jgi:hypothetical protein
MALQVCYMVRDETTGLIDIVSDVAVEGPGLRMAMPVGQAWQSPNDHDEFVRAPVDPG